MSLPGLLRQPITLEQVTWTGTHADYGTATPLTARIEETSTVVSSTSGDQAIATRIAYLPPDIGAERTSRITLANGEQPAILRLEHVYGGDGREHHTVAHLAPIGLDYVTIARPSLTVGAWDPATGLVDQGPATIIYSGPASVLPSTAPTSRAAADQDIYTQHLEVLLPLHTAPVTGRDIVTVTTADDPDLVGATLTVDDISHGADQFYRRLICTLDISPEA